MVNWHRGIKQGRIQYAACLSWAWNRSSSVAIRCVSECLRLGLRSVHLKMQVSCAGYKGSCKAQEEQGSNCSPPSEVTHSVSYVAPRSLWLFPILNSGSATSIKCIAWSR